MEINVSVIKVEKDFMSPIGQQKNDSFHNDIQVLVNGEPNKATLI